MDVVYIVRNGDRNEELRYSLRSVWFNLRPESVWLVGYKPTWVGGVGHILGNGRKLKPANVYHNVLTACTARATPDRFILFNDDFFVTRPVTEVPVYKRGLLSDHLLLPKVQRQANSWWGRSLGLTLELLKNEGIEDPVSYELHVPFPVEKDRMAETLQRFSGVNPLNPPQWRSLYGNLHQIGGAVRPDCKGKEVGVPFHSSDDSNWPDVAPVFKEMFPERCPYELGV